jgi:uncharacterized protein (TIGR02099 family)
MNRQCVSNVNSTMKRLWRAIEVLAWTAFFAFAGLALTLRFWILPDIERYRGDIVSAVSTALGRPVKIGAIDAGWDGLRPQVGFSDVRILDRDGREALVLPRVENVIAWRSLLHLDLRLHSLVVDAPRLMVRRDAAGAFYIAGLKLGEDPGDGRGTDWVLAQDEIVIRGAQIEWRDELRGAPPLTLSALTLRLRNSGERHAIGIVAQPPRELAASLELRAELGGRTVNDLAAWNGRVYAEAGYTDLAAWRPWIDYPINIREGQGALRVWATLNNGRLEEGTADLALAGVRASLADYVEPLELASLNGRVHGRALDDGVELSGRNLSVVMERGPVIPQTDFQIVWRPEAGGALAASLIDLEATASLVEALPLPPQIAQILKDLEPRGRLAESRLEWSGPFDAPKRLSARSRFSDLAMRAREGVPGFSGLAGSIEASEAKGTLSLAAAKVELELPQVFPEPRLALASLNGRIEWRREADGGILVQLPSLAFANRDLSGAAHGSWLHSGAGPGVADLSVLLNRFDGTQLARYLPRAELMGRVTRDWLVNGILAGQASDVRVRLRGDLRDFPFNDPAKGEFRASARVDKGVLRYAQGWPEIRDVDAELVFERKRMDISARAGSILGARIANVRVGIPDFVASSGRVLNVSGQAAGPTQSFLEFVQASPLARRTHGFTDAMSARGDGKLALKIELPFAAPDQVKVHGDFDFAANDVVLHPQIPALERAGGRLSFTEAAFSVRNVRGRLLGGEVVVAGGPRPEGGVEIAARGEAKAEALGLGEPWGRQLAGSARYVARVGLSEGRSRFTIDSSLVGLASALPAPLGKTAAAPLPLHLEIVPGGDGARDRISMRLGRLAVAELQRRRQGAEMVVQRAAVWVSPTPGQPIRLSERPGTLIYGTIPAFDLDRWLALAGGAGGGGGSAALDVRFGVLDAFGKRFNGVAVRAGADAAGWSATVSAEEIAGELSYRGAGDGKLTARLERLSVPADSPAAPQAPAATPGPKADLPAVDLIAEQFAFQGKQLGRVEIQAQRVGPDWRFDRIAMNNPDAAFTAKGIWRRGAAQKTALDFNLEAADTGKFLARVGSPGLVRGGRTGLQGSLSWNGEPGAIDYASLSGDVQMQAENGQFLEVDPGLGKLVSLMSLQALPRRVTLDFRDVFSKGFQYDRITAGGHVERGVMALGDFRMRGSAAQVEMSGTVDLAKETQDLKVRVIPSLGDSAAAALAFLNPLLIFPAVVADRVLKNPLGHIFSFEYAVTGTWSNPNVRRTSVDAREVVPNDSR